jgi:hypothetical protein
MDEAQGRQIVQQVEEAYGHSKRQNARSMPIA